MRANLLRSKLRKSSKEKNLRSSTAGKRLRILRINLRRQMMILSSFRLKLHSRKKKRREELRSMLKRKRL